LDLRGDDLFIGCEFDFAADEICAIVTLPEVRDAPQQLKERL
jgi:hypothetical protein